MNKIWSIGKLMVLEALRDRSIWVSLVIVPLLLTLVMGVAFGGGTQQKKVPLLVVDQDDTTFSNIFVDELRADDAFSVAKTTELAARDKVRRALVSGAIIIPDGYGSALADGSPAKVTVLNTAGDANAALLGQIASGLTNRYSTDSFAAAKTTAALSAASRLPSVIAQQTAWEEAFEEADKAWEPPPVAVEAKTLTASAVRGEKTLAGGFNMSSMGFTVTFIMFMLVGGASSILEERQQGTLARLLTTPTGKSTFLTGKMLGLFVVAGIQAIILIGAGRLIFNVDWGRDPLPLIVILAAFIFSMASLGVLVAALSKTAAQAQSITPVLLISMAMIGGCYWPIEITPPLMQTVARFIPAGWMMRGLVDLITRGYGWSAVITPSLVLLGFGIVFLTAGVAFLKYE